MKTVLLGFFALVMWTVSATYISQGKYYIDLYKTISLVNLYKISQYCILVNVNSFDFSCTLEVDTL